MSLTPDDVNAFIAESFPGTGNRCVEIGDRYAVVEFTVEPDRLRPGGYVSGPTQFGAADAALAPLPARLGEDGGRPVPTRCSRFAFGPSVSLIRSRRGVPGFERDSTVFVLGSNCGEIMWPRNVPSGRVDLCFRAAS